MVGKQATNQVYILENSLTKSLDFTTNEILIFLASIL
jgi:hypothetical protein